MKRYVAGFAFSEDLELVLLIRKTHPEWQKGKLNGVGGKIREGELPPDAMVREFAEETGFSEQFPAVAMQASWFHYLTHKGSDHVVEFFWIKLPISVLTRLKCPEEETLEIHYTDQITVANKEIIPNLAWIVPLALDNERGLTGCGVKHTVASEV